MVRVRPSKLQQTVINSAPQTLKNGVVRKQLQLRQMLLDPKAFLRVINKKKGKKKTKKVTKQNGGNLKQSRKPINKLPTIYQYYQ
jgi:hypothetical protein